MVGEVSSPIVPGNNFPFPLGFRACLHFVRIFKEKAQDMGTEMWLLSQTFQALFAVDVSGY